MGEIIFLLVLGTSLWVLVDATTLKVKKGKIKGLFDMGVAGWFFCCLLLWIVGFPAYLAKRGEYKRLKEIQNVPSKIVSDPTEQLKTLAELHQTGALTDEEFQTKKKELLARL